MPAPEKSKHPQRLQELLKEQLETVLSLTQMNSDLLLARQQASGLEIDILTAEREHSEQNPNKTQGSKDTKLSEIYAQHTKAKQRLAEVEYRVEKMECRLAEITLSIAKLEV